MKAIFSLLCICSLTHASLFTITDKKGNVFKSKEMKPTYNACLNQKTTEYSLQAIYDELNRDANFARMAKAARLRAKRISNAQVTAKKAGKTYHVSERDRQKLLADAKMFKGGALYLGRYNT